MEKSDFSMVGKKIALDLSVSSTHYLYCIKNYLFFMKNCEKSVYKQETSFIAQVLNMCYNKADCMGFMVAFNKI